MAHIIKALIKEINGRIFFYLFYSAFIITTIYCQNCKDIHDISNIDCFNDIITFDHENWRSGHASINNNGDMIIEFSLEQLESDSRLFYGLKKKWKILFPWRTSI